MNATATEIRLADCVDLLAGFAFKSDRFQDPGSGGVPLVKGENIGQGRILWDISRYWPSNEDGLDKFRLLPGDVVLAMDRPWVPAGLKWAVIRDGDPDAFLVQRCARLRSRSPDLRQDFLRYVIGGPGFEAYIRPITTGVNVPHISGAQILGYNFRLPPVEEQKRIAGILSAYDDLIENCERRIRVLDEMARSLYREWFVDNPPASKRRSGLLGDMIELHRGYDLPASARLDGTVPIVSSSGPTGWHNEAKMSPPGVVTGRYGTLGSVFLVMEPYWPLNTTLYVSDFKGSDPVFVYFLLSSLDLSRQNTAGAVPGLNRNALHLLPVKIPDADSQARFGAVAGENMRHIDLLKVRIKNLRATRDLLLPRLLSGQLSVDDAA